MIPKTKNWKQYEWLAKWEIVFFILQTHVSLWDFIGVKDVRLGSLIVKKI